jgi:hypothetical protein
VDGVTQGQRGAGPVAEFVEIDHLVALAAHEE